MPMRARVEPTGRGMGQRLARMSAARARVAPVASEQGRTCRWTEEPVMRRARCGATMPTNPSGPQKAVTVPVIRQADSIDSVWVKVARDQTTQGWARESQLLQAVSPDAPISQFIDYFSDTHLLFFLAFFSIVVAAYIVMRQRRRNAMLVHFNDIRSFYPMLLALLVAASAVFYSTIQLHNPESWRHYYYHPRPTSDSSCSRCGP